MMNEGWLRRYGGLGVMGWGKKHLIWREDGEVVIYGVGVGPRLKICISWCMIREVIMRPTELGV
jgi:hypothetical protein